MTQHAWFRTALAVFVLGLGIFSATASGAAAGEDEAFRPLFNGRDLQGWVNVNCAPETWQTSGSVIHCSGVPTGMLRTERMYRNFILEVEWRHLKPKGNAGIFVWSDPLPARGQPFVRGVEVQVLDGQEGSWFTSDGDIFPVHGARMVPENGRGGDRAFPTEKRVRPSPEWNSYRIHCEEGAITLAVNGKVVTRGHSASPRKGYICLESEGSPAEFRNIRIRELPSGEALPVEQIAAPAEGFRPLYNGVNLDGWTADGARHWKSADWILEHDGRSSGPAAALRSREEFGDVELIVDWRRPGKAAETGEAAGDSGAGISLRDSGTSGVLIPFRPGGAGEWNRYRITLRGNRLDVEANREKILENEERPGVPERGAIVLRPSGGPVQFANILVRELDRATMSAGERYRP